MNKQFSVMQMMNDLGYFKEGSIFLDQIKIVVVDRHISIFHADKHYEYIDKHYGTESFYVFPDYNSKEYTDICPDIKKCKLQRKYEPNDAKTIMKYAIGMSRTFWKNELDMNAVSVIINYANKLIL